MLFQLSPNSPRFAVFELLNKELLYFIEQSITSKTFLRELFSAGAVGQACWDNAKENDKRAERDLTRDKFAKLFAALQGEQESVRRQLLKVCRDNQDLGIFFANPNRNLLGFLPPRCESALKNLATHLYCATKDLQALKDEAGGIDINAHFNSFRALAANGNVCKACGMEELAPYRAGVPDGDQWRADYDHQLCKSKYPIFAVHPDNLVPLCDVCNQDAKEAKDLFRSDNGSDRVTFYPHAEEAKDLVGIEIGRLLDPEPTINVVWLTNDTTQVDKLETWNEVYGIRSRVEGRFRSLEVVLEDEINPNGLRHLKSQIKHKARSISEETLKRKEWAYWHHKLFQKLSSIDIVPFWEKSKFTKEQGADGGEYILNFARQNAKNP